MSSQRLNVTRRNMSISLAVVLFLLTIFSLNPLALPKASRHKESSPKVPTSTVVPRPPAVVPAASAQTRTIVLNTGYDQWLASPKLINVFEKDNEWRVISDPVNGAPQPPTATGRPSDVVPDSTWNLNPLLAANFPNSRWISITPLQGQPLPTPPNRFEYAYYFTLPDGFTNPELMMKLFADDQITKVTLNSTILFQGAGGYFYSDPLLLPSSPLTSANFHSGPTVNVITVEVEDTFAGSTGLIVDGQVSYEDCTRLPIRNIPGLTSITFWESTGALPTSPSFLVSGSHLSTKLNGTLSSTNRDFEGVTEGEFYDVFYSDWSGAPNPSGQFVTIEAVWRVGAPSGGGLNIARVDFNGTGKFASSVASFVALGNNAMPNGVGKAVDFDPNALTTTTMGNTIGQAQRLRVTVGFPCACVGPPSGMVGWWPLDDPTGDTIVDDIAAAPDNGSPKPGLAIGPSSPSSVPAVVGTGLNFLPSVSPIGPTHYVEVPSSPEVNFGTGDFTIDAWIKLDQASNIHPIVDKLDFSTPGTNKGYAFFVQGGRLTLRLAPDAFGGLVGSVSTGPGITPGDWHHVAVTIRRNDPSNKPVITFYINAVYSGSSTTSGPSMPGSLSIDGTMPLWIGGNSRLAFGGATVSLAEIAIDELEFFKRELSQTEIQSIFNAGSAGKCKPGSCQLITINPATLVHEAWAANVDYPALKFTATGGTAPYTFSFNGITLPPGMVVDSDGTLHGKPVTPDRYTFDVTVVDANGCPGTCRYRLAIISCPVITISPATIPSGTASVAYNQTFTAAGGASPYTFSVSGGSLPPGLTLSSTGTLSGTPTQKGSFTFSVKATDANGCVASRSYQFAIGCQDIIINPTSLPIGTTGTAYNQTLTATGGCAPNTFSLLTGTLPPGLTLSPNGTLSGIPTVSGNFAFASRVTNNCGCTSERSYVLTIQQFGTTGSIIGRVVDPRNNPVSGAQVRASGQPAVLTNSNGEFNIQGLPATQRLAVSFSAAGFMETTRVYEVGGSSRNTGNVVVIWPRVAPASLNATQGGKLTFPGGSVRFPPRALVDELGRPLQGEVRVAFSVLDITDRRQLRSAPGDFTARMPNGRIRQLETFGVFEVYAENSNGQRAKLAPGKTAAIELSIPQARRRTAPRRVGLFSFDGNSGRWIAEGILRRSPGRVFYRTRIPAINTFWNADMPLDTTCITLKILKEDGTPAPVGTRVEAEGVDYSGTSPTGFVYNSMGEVCLSVKKCVATVRIVAYDQNNSAISSCPVRIQTPCQIASAADCGNPTNCPLQPEEIILPGSTPGTFYHDLNAHDLANWHRRHNGTNYNSTNNNFYDVWWYDTHVVFSNDGIMRLLLDATPPPGPPLNTTPVTYSSGEYRTNVAYGYGTYEVCMKPAKGPGLMSSFFTYTGPFETPATRHDEIDIEFRGSTTNVMWTNFFFNGDDTNHEQEIPLTFDAADDFHRYKFVWTASQIDWYVDGVWKRTADSTNYQLPSYPGKIMVNLWSGNANSNGWLGTFDPSKIPVYAEYDWIRYKQP